jgi:phosphoribosylamine--glycine ligase
MNILLLGSGGREHAIAWKLARSPLLTSLFIAPGNPGTARHGINLEISTSDFAAIRQAVISHNIGMVVVGPEDPLVSGIHDYFLNDPVIAHIPVIGPQKTGARLEGSKDFAKQFMIRHGIPTARYQTFDRSSLDEGIRFLQSLSPPYVLKADGLAAGKGVIICQTPGEAIREFTSMITEARFGDASRMVVIEEFLTGIELSVFVITDGTSYKLLPEAKDYKKIGEADTGPNTGGMGSVSPVPFAGEDFMRKVEERVIRPTIAGLKQEEIPYQGFIFFGLMKVGDDPFVIEYNCRLGDPETESVLPRLQNDLLRLFIAVAGNTLSGETIVTDPRSAATVMLVSQGYPGSYPKGMEITGEENVRDCLVFHAGTSSGHSGGIVTSGGRVMAVSALGGNMQEALSLANAGAALIRFEGKNFRSDIGFDL